ncbi:selenide, water dikinase SelD [Roseicyclus persicicus]|uniref:Selenide, water dikinase SelD n=1 Tax=Roseicyclus persicicus TaxID=2650661 RepID=A0A7X6GW29_9RHOB|nr:selenide, water dikinase SelD [Roseibacterium persicicum]NKX43383.1 selenide, water dikinase SelD [Roseibacterium persicicum]
MLGATVPLVKELVLVGGGHTHALVLRRWGMRPVPGVRLTLVNPGPTAPYTGMLPGHVAGHYAREELDIDLVRLARFAGARLVLGAVELIDPVARKVLVPGRAPMGYDLLSVDIGITSDMAGLPGFAEHGIAAKPLGRFADAWAAYCTGEGPARIAVIGGGVAGVELALACAERMNGLGRAAEIAVIDRGAVLGGWPGRAQLIRALDAYGIARIEGAAPVEVTATAVRLADGREVASDFTIGAAGAVPHGWLGDCGMEMRDGFLVVDDQLRSVSHPDIYGAGDCVHLAASPRPKAGVFAVRAAPVLAWNLRADLTGAQRRRFRPQRDFLKLVSLGGKDALAEKAGWTWDGPAMWRWKDRIDQRFMEKFRSYPAMPSPAAPKGAAAGVAQEMAGPAPCGGCGAKLGAGALTGILGGRPGDDAAVLEVGDARQVISTDHIRAFAEDPVLVARAAAIHAMGDIWAMGARPQAALATVILPRMRAGLQGAWLDEVMAAARDVFAAEGVEVVGGHSSMGTELTLGFTVTGLLEREAITLAGARPGDALVLGRGIGTGVVLAGEMRMLAQGAEVAATWAQVTTPQEAAAAILSASARAMTDVTGFGLAGHLGNICAASGVGAEVDLTALPLLPGALRLSGAGVRSTLWPQNRAALAARVEVPDTPLGALVFDPQTAGGFLAAVPDAEAAGLVEALRAAGFDAARIGTVTEGPAIRFA